MSVEVSKEATHEKNPRIRYARPLRRVCVICKRRRVWKWTVFVTRSEFGDERYRFYCCASCFDPIAWR